MAQHKQSGFTLVELLIVIAIIAILTAIAVPSFSDMIERNKLKQAAEGVKSDLQWTRSESIKQSCNIPIVFTPATWQYVISPCTSGAKTIIQTSSAVSMSNPAFTDNIITFNFRRGESEDGGVTLTTTNYQVTVEVDDGRRIRICNPVAANAVGGYESC